MRHISLPSPLRHSRTCLLYTSVQAAAFSVYADVRDKLIGHGVPPGEIAFIHDADNEKKKAELFAKVRSGKVRILLGSTQKMGAGTNVRATRSQLKRLRSSQNFLRLKGA